jgi:hypothetical protein
MNRKFFTAVAAAALSIAMASTASAAVFVGVGDTTGNLEFAGFAADVGFDDDISATLNLTLTNITGGAYTFSYALTNTSSGDDADAKISSFGFNVNPNFTTASINGFFDTVGNGNFVQNQPNLEFCGTNANDPPGPNAASCTAVGNDADTVDTGDGTVTGFFTLNFNPTPGQTGVELTDLRMRVGSLANGNSGYLAPCVGDQCDGGGNQNEVPEPSTWALMILGFGAAGYMLRRRRRQGRLFL